jgi:hypothetical protein
MKKATTRWSSHGSILHVARYAAEEEMAKLKYMHKNHK